MYSRCIALHVTAIRVYIPSLLPSSSSKTRHGAAIVYSFTLYFMDVVLCVYFPVIVTSLILYSGNGESLLLQILSIYLTSSRSAPPINNRPSVYIKR